MLYIEKVRRILQSARNETHIEFPRHPQANGLVERLNQTLIPAIKAHTQNEEGRDWDVNLKFVQRDLNNSPHKATGKSPFYLLYGYKPRHDDGSIRQVLKNNNEIEQPKIVPEQARQAIMENQQKYKERYDKNRVITITYNIGDTVYMQRAPTATGNSTKLKNKYKGPLVIYRILPNDTYGVTNLNNDPNNQRYATTAHVTQLKLWKPHRDDEEDTDESEEEYDNNIEQNNEHNATTQDIPVSTEPVENIKTGRPARHHRVPKRFNDFVLNTFLEDED